MAKAKTTRPAEPGIVKRATKALQKPLETLTEVVSAAAEGAQAALPKLGAKSAVKKPTVKKPTAKKITKTVKKVTAKKKTAATKATAKKSTAKKRGA